MTLNITVKTSDNYTSYHFKARGTGYQVVTNGQGSYDVWTTRYGKRPTGARVMTLVEMANGTKTMQAFASWMTKG